jgi:hypothetical protein
LNLTILTMTMLHSVNAIRVISEYFVIRLHTFAWTIGMDSFVRDLMSFFFVLSGFVMMHTHHSTSFTTTKHRCDFWVSRWKKAYPAYIINYALRSPVIFVRAFGSESSNRCIYKLYCSLIEIVILNPWSGCGVDNLINSVDWYIGTLAWLWFVFPFIHGTLKEFFNSRIWAKMLLINVISAGLISAFSGYEIFTICTLPVLRLGEFVIGCAAACALEQLDPPEQMESKPLTMLQWTPFTLILMYMAVLYTVFALPHGLESLCLHEDSHHKGCSLWETSKWIEENPPCLLVWDKYFNKHAILWAVIIYTVASAEKSNDQGVFMRLLGHDVFKGLSSFSLSLYLGHISVNWLLVLITDSLGWTNFWRDDALLLTIYALCYLLHLLTQKITAVVFKSAPIFTPL